MNMFDITTWWKPVGDRVATGGARIDPDPGNLLDEAQLINPRIWSKPIFTRVRNHRKRRSASISAPPCRRHQNLNLRWLVCCPLSRFEPIYKLYAESIVTSDICARSSAMLRRSSKNCSAKAGASTRANCEAGSIRGNSGVDETARANPCSIVHDCRFDA